MRHFLLTLLAVAFAAHLAHAADPAAATAVRSRVESLGGTCVVAADGDVTAVVIADGSGVGADDVDLLARLTGLRKLHIFDCRGFDDAQATRLAGLPGLESLAITNSGIGDEGVAAIARALPGLVEIDLSSNVNLTGAAMKSIASLVKLERLGLMQTRFNDLQMRRLGKLAELEVLDIRGVMEAGDTTLGVLGGLPRLRALKHRSSAVTDDGMAELARCRSLEALLAQDFAITDASGPHFAALAGLKSLEIFRCAGFGSDGLRGLGPLKKLERLTLRDLPNVGDTGLAVLADLPNLRELTIRDTGATEQSLEAIASLPRLESLTFVRNGAVSAAVAEKVRAAKAWKKIDFGT